ncbi:MAG: hypothetical protein JXA46_11510 [Dehalococcoidales bacterium]|nr:hypothetical protein [Dehalococcoidales bacterium]
MEVYKILREYFSNLVSENHLESEEIVIQARPLTTEEAIGNPEDRDYPLITGRERMMQAQFRNTFGQAYTDMYGDYSGKLSDIAGMELKNNFRRAIFISSLNAVMRNLELVEKTVHCKDNEPRECSVKLVEYVMEKYGKPRVAMVGLQPRIVEALSKHLEIKVTDLDNANINTEKYGVNIHSPEKIREHLEWCDLIVATGSTIVNNTINDFLDVKPVIFYGVTIAGAAKVLKLDDFCYCAK